jgi:thiol-disulfide isomerase/thioredoxin
MNLPVLLKKLRPDWLTAVLLGLIVYVWFRPPAWVSDESRFAPALQVISTNGEQISLAQLRGKVVLVNFWATWCPYCRHEMPAMEAFYRDYRNRGFEIVALSQDDDPGVVRRFLAEQGYHFPAAMAPSAAGGFEVSRLPTSFVIGKDGRIRHKITGQVYYGRLEELIRPLLAE